jgi:hypothetical protein
VYSGIFFEHSVKPSVGTRNIHRFQPFGIDQSIKLPENGVIPIAMIRDSSRGTYKIWPWFGIQGAGQIFPKEVRIIRDLGGFPPPD